MHADALVRARRRRADWFIQKRGATIMRQLLHGVRIFQHRVFPACRTQFEQLAKGQAPSTLFITCSDSRIVPELVTQTAPGELFVLRNAGNLVPPFAEAEPSGEAATIEFAIEVLKVRDVIICGHSDCGAIKGLLNPETLVDLPSVRGWLKHAEATRGAISHLHGADKVGEAHLTAAIEANVKLQLAHLRTYPAVGDAEARGDLSLHGWFYRFETGDVNALDEETGAFVSVLHLLTQEASVA
jgi:carbonic anhydrase